MRVPAATIALCGLAITATVCAPTADQAPATDETALTQPDVETLKATINAHWEAINAGDGETATAHHMPRFTGFLSDEGPLLEFEAPEQLEITVVSNWRPRDLMVDLYGDVGVAAFCIEGSETWPDGRVVQGPRRVTAVWIWDGSEWKEAHHHDSPLVSASAE